MSFCNYKFGSMDVKSWTLYFCIGEYFLRDDWQPKHITQKNNYIMLQQAELCENECKSTTSFDMAHLSHHCWLFFPIVSTCILNQSKGHWLLSDALNFAISMSLIQGWNWFYNLWQLNGRKWKYCLWVVMFGFQHKEGSIQVLDSFISFLKNYEERKAHNCFL
jgi:hypothetical protein